MYTMRHCPGRGARGREVERPERVAYGFLAAVGGISADNNSRGLGAEGVAKEMGMGIR